MVFAANFANEYESNQIAFFASIRGPIISDLRLSAKICGKEL